MAPATVPAIRTGDTLPTRSSSAKPRSLELAQAGVKTANEFAKLMSALMSDIIEGSITPAVGHASCNAGGKLLKVVEMQLKYGRRSEGANVEPVLKLTGE